MGPGSSRVRIGSSRSRTSSRPAGSSASPFSSFSSWSPTRPGGTRPRLLLGGLGVTDGVDGYVARHFNQVSTLGKVLDPLADRLLLGAAGDCRPWSRSHPAVGRAWPPQPRGAGRSGLPRRRRGRRPPDGRARAGKAGTFGLMFALPLFLAGHATDGWHRIAEVLAWVCVVPGSGLGWYAAVTLCPDGAGRPRREQGDPARGGPT